MNKLRDTCSKDFLLESVGPQLSAPSEWWELINSSQHQNPIIKILEHNKLCLACVPTPGWYCLYFLCGAVTQVTRRSDAGGGSSVDTRHNPPSETQSRDACQEDLELAVASLYCISEWEVWHAMMVIVWNQAQSELFPDSFNCPQIGETI